jgi:hypothetical protein
MPPETEKKEEEKKGNLPDAVTEALEEIKKKLENPPVREEAPVRTGPTVDERRAEIQKKMGYTDEQMSAHEEMIMRSQAPLIENTGWTRLEKKPDIENYRKEIEAELAIYPQERRTPDVMEKIYFMVRGKKLDSKPPEKKPESGTRVVDSKVSRGPGYSGAEPGLSGSGGADDSKGEEELSDVEKFVAAKLGVSDKDYQTSKAAGKEIRGLRIPDERPATSMADIELRRLTARR